MTNPDQTKQVKLDRVSATLLIIPIAMALSLIFFFYIPGIDRFVNLNQLPREVVSLKLHIVAYCLSYSLFVGGLLLTTNRLFARTMRPYLWIEGTAIIATFFAILGLIFGIPASKSMWGQFWVWDIKQVSTISATIVFVGISIAVVLTRLIPSEKFRNVILLFLFIIAVILCAALFLIGRVFGLTIHPQWFPEFFLR